MRLTEKSYALGLANVSRYQLLQKKKTAMEALIEFIVSYSVNPFQVNDFLANSGTAPLSHGCKLVDLLVRPQLTIHQLSEILFDFSEQIRKFAAGVRCEEILEAVEISIKYAGYIKRERQIADKISRLENLHIQGKFDYDSIQSLSTEARQKLKRINPATLAQASRISGISPSDINILLILLGR